MKLVLFGATGYAGSRILAEATARGHEVVAVARHVDTVKRTAGVSPVRGSILDVKFVHDLASNADVMICAVSPRPAGEAGKILDAFPILVDAARLGGTRLGVIGGASSLLVSEGGERVFTTLPATMPPEVMAEIKAHMEFFDRLRDVPPDVDWFYLSPPLDFGAYSPGERLGRYRLGGDILLKDADGRSWISGEDLAVAVIDEVERPKHHRRRFTVAY